MSTTQHQHNQEQHHHDHQHMHSCHEKAAHHLEQAAKCHRQAMEHCKNKHHEKATACALEAHGHTIVAKDHTNKLARHCCGDKSESK